MNNYPIRFMLAGIAFMLLGIFIQMDASHEWYGSAFFLEILGVLLVLFGLFYEFVISIIDKSD